MTWSVRLMLGMAVITDTARAADDIRVSDGDTVQITLSAREVTRIAMTDGIKLGRILAPDGSLDVHPGTDAQGKETGDAFVKPLNPVPGKALSFFLRDDRGATYTVIAQIADVPSHTVMLRPNDPAPIGHAGASPEKAEPFIRRMKSLARAMQSGDNDAGDYTRHRVGKLVPVWQQVAAVLDERWSAASGLSGEVWTYRNVTSGELHLDETQFIGLYPDICAVAIEHQALPAGASSRVFLLRGAPGARP